MFAQPQSESLKFEAQNLMKSGKYGEAIEILNRYISAEPQNPEGYSLRGSCFERRGQFEMAVYDYRSALKLDPRNETYHKNLARVKEEWDILIYNKIEGYKREIAINPLEPRNYLEIGKSYKNLGKWKEAEKWYDEYLKREEASADEILRYTEILAKNNHIKKGEPILKRYTEMYPDDHRIWSRYGYFTMWLGKKKTAIKAFEKALELRPYFKEALDGYDLARGKGYIYTVNDTTTRYNYGLPVYRKHKVYAIDRYYRKLKNNPEDVNTRYKLIDELIKHNRYEEAVEQVNKLALTESGTEKYETKKREVFDKRNEYYANRIEVLKNYVSSNPADKEKILELGRYYSNLGKYNDAINLYNNYLNTISDDDDIRYRKAQALAWNKQLNNARNDLEVLLSHQPGNTDYQLLNGQVLLWMNEDLDEAEKNFNAVLEKDPKNLQALIGLASLNYQKNNLTSAKLYVNRGFLIDPYNKDLVRLEKSIQLQSQRNVESALYSKLEKAREYAFNKECDKAIEYYNQYFADSSADEYLKKELAQAYLCKEDYNTAVEIYNELINKYPGDYELAKQRAKVYYWMGDSLNALLSFEELAAQNPGDAEAKLFLGDSYMKMGDYKNARSVYEELLAIAPTSYILQKRMNWLGSAGLDGYSAGAFPTYFSIIPDGYYFNDNLDFTYSRQGLRVEMGITSYLSLGAGGFFGFISSDAGRLNLNIYKLDGFITFSKTVTGFVGGGIIDFRSAENTTIFEAGIKAQEENKYTFAASFYSSDAAVILYSPFLVENRLTANYLLFTGEYITENSILLRADYSYTSVSDDNAGSRLIFRLGKIFEKVFGVGYEYYYYNFNNLTPLYWSPQNFESHSLWVDWDAVKEERFSLNLKGRVGLIPTDNFVLRELYAYFRFYFERNLFLQASTSFGTTVQQLKGYSSYSFGLSLYWSL